MRLAWGWLLLLVSGCDASFFAFSTAPTAVGTPTPAPQMAGPWGYGGGGGGTGQSQGQSIRTTDPLPDGACPPDYSAEVERRIAEVADRRSRDALWVQWRNIEKVANAGGPEELLGATQSFRLIVDRLQRHGDISDDQAVRLRALLHCYVP